MKAPCDWHRHAQVHRQHVGAPAAVGFMDLIFTTSKSSYN